MDKVQVFIRDLDSDIIEQVLDDSDLSSWDFLGDERYILGYRDLADLGDTIEQLENAGADIEEV
jgi:hypothetical protein